MTQAGDNEEPERQKREKSKQQQGEDSTKQSETSSKNDREQMNEYIRQLYG